jgi:hypothetical protein
MDEMTMSAAYGRDEEKMGSRADAEMWACGGGGRSTAGSLERLLTVRGGGRARRDENGGRPRLRYIRMRRAPMNEATQNYHT